MLATCLHFLKGTPYIYQGEELGMTNRRCSNFEEFKDIEIKNAYKDFVESGILSEEQMLTFVNAVGRDNARFPMHWDETEHAGFTTGIPWISVNENYKKINAKEQMERADSVYHYYKQLIALRHSMDVMVYGMYEELFPDHTQLFAYTRTLGDEKLFVYCNFSEEEVEVPMSDIGMNVGAEKSVLISNYEDCKAEGEVLFLRPYEAKVFVVLMKA